MNVKEIITAWLKEHGYDGLCGEECGCEIADLAPCCEAENILSCVPGYKNECDYPCSALAEGWCMRPDVCDLRGERDNPLL